MIMSFSLKEVGGTDGWVYPSPHNQQKISKNFSKKNFYNFSKKKSLSIVIYKYSNKYS